MFASEFPHIFVLKKFSKCVVGELLLRLSRLFSRRVRKRKALKMVADLNARSAEMWFIESMANVQFQSNNSAWQTLQIFEISNYIFPQIWNLLWQKNVWMVFEIALYYRLNRRGTACGRAELDSAPHLRRIALYPPSTLNYKNTKLVL